MKYSLIALILSLMLLSIALQTLRTKYNASYHSLTLYKFLCYKITTNALRYYIEHKSLSATITYLKMQINSTERMNKWFNTRLLNYSFFYMTADNTTLASANVTFNFLGVNYTASVVLFIKVLRVYSIETPQGVFKKVLILIKNEKGLPLAVKVERALSVKYLREFEYEVIVPLNINRLIIIDDRGIKVEVKV